MRLPFKETITTVVCVVILCGLGTWQLQRLQWKNHIVQTLQTAYATQDQDTLLSPDVLETLANTDNPIAYGRVEGTLLRDKALLLGPRTQNGKAGYHLIIPLQTPQNHVLLVNVGWVSELWKDTFEDRMASMPHDLVHIKGLLRKADWSSFSSKNSPGNDLWFRADIGEISKAKNLENTYPFLLYTDSSTPELIDVTLHEKGWLPRNKHMQYAFFWFAMAVAMLGVYGFYIVGAGKKKAP